MSSRSRALVAGVLVSALAVPAWGQAQFSWIPLPDGATGVYALAVSDGDSPKIVGYCLFPSDHRAFRWRAATGFEFLGDGTSAEDLSADGTVVVGTRALSGGGGEAIRWTASDVEGFGSASSADCVTADGATAFGRVPGIAGLLCWRGGQDSELIGIPEMDAGSLGACNQDGTWFAITSWDGQAHVAARWSASTGFQSIGELPGGETYSMPYAISDDGNVIVGVSWSGTAFEEAFRWTPETGIVGLGSTLGGTESKALGMSADGSLVVGRGGGAEAITWDSTNGMRSLTAMLLQDYALDLSDAVLWEVRAISRDGRNIAGVGRERWSGPVKMWLVHMEPCCTPADLNCDLRVDISDLALLLSHFGSCAADAGFWPRADIDRRGCVDLPDLAALLSSFGSDCR